MDAIYTIKVYYYWMNVLWVLGTMGKLKTLGVILSVALAVLAYCLYTPMPPEAEEPFQQMKFLAKFKSIMGFVSVIYFFLRFYAFQCFVPFYNFLIYYKHG